MTVLNWRTRATLMICTMFSLFAFQNCGGAKFSESADQSSSSDPTSATAGANGTNTTSGTTSGTGGTSGTGTTSGTRPTAGTGSTSGSTSGSGSSASGTGSTTGSTSGTGSSTTQSCGNKILVNGVCVDFSCQSVVQISAAQLQSIPARDANGICYAYHLFNSIPFSASTLTNRVDSTVTSANHDVSYSANHSPYLMASFQGAIKLLGARVVKLAGAADATTPILIDNFLLYGVYPSSVSNPNPSSYYKVSGTSDSAVFNGNTRTNYVLFDQVALTVNPFATSGTSTIAPIDISTSVPANVSTMLDLRAEDCGSARQLSDIYLLFQ